MSDSNLEAAFLLAWRGLTQGDDTMPAPEHEFVFHDGRGWRFDFAWPDVCVAVEIDGGTWSGGRHTRGKGYRDDCEKCNAAQCAGWIVLHFTSDMLDDPQRCIDSVMRALGDRLLQ